MQIVDYAIYRFNKPDQYAVRYQLASGSWTRYYRISGITPTASNWKQEPPDTIIAISRAASLLMQDLIQSDTLQPANTRFKTCGEAMSAYIAWRSEHRRNPAATQHAKPFLSHFGEMPLTRLTPTAAQEWIEKQVASGAAYDTVRNRVAMASGLITWLTDEGVWYPRNPFHGQLKRYANKFPVSPPCPSTVSIGRYAELQSAASERGYKTAATYMECAYCTGLRPSEVVRLDTRRLDRESLTWTTQVTKTVGRTFWRTIAVPQRLVTFLVAHDVSGVVVTSKAVLRQQMQMLGIGQKIFRKDFAHRMEAAGASSEIINLHQGRQQSGVLYEHYLTDPQRAVRLCRPYIDQMFFCELFAKREAVNKKSF